LLTETDTHTLDYEHASCSVMDGATPVSGFSLARTDNLNITGITNTVTTANNQTLAYSAANRLNSASGPYGAQSWIFDGVGTLARASGTTAPLKTPRPWGERSPRASTPIPRRPTRFLDFPRNSGGHF
jgi:hypothetical protein